MALEKKILQGIDFDLAAKALLDIFDICQRSDWNYKY